MTDMTYIFTAPGAWPKV